MELHPSQTQENVHIAIVQEFSKTLEMFGFTTADSRLFASLYLKGKAMTLDEMSDLLGKSKTSISTGIRNLVEQGLVEKVWKKGVRKDYYKADEQLYKKFMITYVQRWIEASYAQTQSLERLKESLSSTNQEILQNRLNQMIEFHKQITASFEGSFNVYKHSPLSDN
ncbi:GbsR/MarR family transcriptional regulator [Halobacillus sp. Marseille-P3879]|uniref:GbsR/MarR family transcriptional regulator n=1 Tax=Halobacillus TaxID=45667 RepID=UPI000C7B567C|nr:helix-turn-helix domain-containing protein [Halobacillus sp. Marseille-P3879]